MAALEAGSPGLDRVIVYALSLALVLVFAGSYFVWTTLAGERPLKDIPFVFLEEDGLSPRESWRNNARKVLHKGLSRYDGPFQVATGLGPVVVLPNRFADELKNHPDLKFGEAALKGFFPSYPGFEPFEPFLKGENAGFLPEVVRIKITQSLGLITRDLVDETTRAVHDIFGEDEEWHKTSIRECALDLVARLSSRVFLGEKICRDKRWLEIARDFTVHCFTASRTLKATNPLIRPFIHWFLQPCITLRKDLKQANDIIMPEINRRAAAASKALAAGEKPPKTADAIGWMVESATEKRKVVNYVYAQLNLSLVAIHTTSEALTGAIIDLLAHPELIQPLRDEAISIITELGWERTSLYKMRLMDSFLKESQRVHPPNQISMRRLVKKPFRLSTGQILPPGTLLGVTNGYLDPRVHEDPLKFDAWRFVGVNDNSSASYGPAGSVNGKLWQHVGVNSSHMAFGYGSNACPGRFFASNEMKISLVHLLLKYDFRTLQPDYVAATKAMHRELESNVITTADSEMEIRRRREEIVIDMDDRDRG